MNATIDPLDYRATHPDAKNAVSPAEYYRQVIPYIADQIWRRDHKPRIMVKIERKNGTK